MAETYIPIGENNKKAILNFIGMCRMNGLEENGEPSFTFKDPREGIGVVMFDLFYRSTNVLLPGFLQNFQRFPGTGTQDIKV